MEKTHVVAVCLAMVLALAVGARAELSPLCGDGVHDDAAAIQPTIGIDSDATVEHLVIRNCRQVNETKDDMVFLTVHGKVEKLELGEVSLKYAPGAGRNILRDDTADCGRFFPHFTPNLRLGYRPPAKGK